MTGAERAAGLRLLAQLAVARLPLVRIVAILPSLCAPVWQQAAVTLKQRVSSGERLSSTLAMVVPDLPPHLIAIVRAGEDSATLAAALERAAVDAEETERRRRELLQTLSYPAVLVTTGVACVLVVAMVVLPRFEEILLGLGQELPASAQLLLRIVHEAPRGLAVLGVLATGGWVVARFQRRDFGSRRHLGDSLLRFPLIGSLFRLQAIERVCAMLSTLLGSGLAIPKALTLAVQGASSGTLADGLSAARGDVVRGSALSLALERAAVLPGAFAQLLRVGEETGTLGSALSQVASLARDRRDSDLRRLVGFVEPTVLLGVALFVGGVAAVLMQTIYSVRPLQ